MEAPDIGDDYRELYENQGMYPHECSQDILLCSASIELPYCIMITNCYNRDEFNGVCAVFYKAGFENGQFENLREQLEWICTDKGYYFRDFDDKRTDPGKRCEPFQYLVNVSVSSNVPDGLKDDLLYLMEKTK